MTLSSRLIGSEDGDDCTRAHPDDPTAIAHTKSTPHEREFLNRVLDSNSGAIDSNSTMARTSNNFWFCSKQPHQRPDRNRETPRIVDFRRAPLCPGDTS